MEWGQRLGFLVPSANSVLERDTRIALPDGLSAHFARMKLTRDTPEEISGLVDQVPSAAGEVADAGVDVIGFACTTGSLDGGLGYDQKIIDIITTATGVPATTTSSAVILALRELGIRNPLVVSPYEEWLNEKVVRFLADSGVGVAGVVGLGLPDPRECEAVGPEHISDVSRNADTAEADGIFISCTGFRGLEAVEGLEQALGKPVISSNQATIWLMLAMIRVATPVHGFGRLLELPRLGVVAAA
jgi:maleate isomerase